MRPSSSVSPERDQVLLLPELDAHSGGRGAALGVEDVRRDAHWPTSGRTLMPPTLRHVPAVEQRRRRPARVGLGLLPAGRPGALAHHALAFGPVGRRFDRACACRPRPLPRARPRPSTAARRSPREPRDRGCGRASRSSGPSNTGGSSRLTYQPITLRRAAEDPDRVGPAAREDDHEPPGPFVEEKRPQQGNARAPAFAERQRAQVAPVGGDRPRDDGPVLERPDDRLGAVVEDAQRQPGVVAAVGGESSVDDDVARRPGHAASRAACTR